MNAQVIQLAPIPVVMLKHVGPYEQLGPVFEQLWNWVTANSIPAQRAIGIYWDNPDFTPASQLRSAACAEVPIGFRVQNSGGLPLEVNQIPAGNYVTTRFVGPYEQLEPVWTQLTEYTERTLGKTITDNPAFEVYVNDPSDTPASQLITELYMPVE